MHVPTSILDKARTIKGLICDLDGVLTAGELVYGPEGELLKTFHVHDGFGLKLLMESGIKVAIITMSNTPIIDKRMKDLGIVDYYQGQITKIAAFEDCLSRWKLTAKDVAYIGDDYPDLPLIERAGLGVTVPDASLLVQQAADYITDRQGGFGAVRELCEAILFAQESLSRVLEKYYS